jgi:3-oxoacyl-[acyl-carrier protein] reductase
MTEAPDLVWKGDLLAGELAIVTGSARGIGLATARQLGNLGAKIALFDLNEDGVKASAAELRDAGIEATSHAGDVSNPDDVSALAEHAASWAGQPVSVLVSNAGILRDRSLKNMTIEEWDEVMKVHLYGGFHALKSVWNQMLENRRGAVTFLSSTASIGAFGQGNYGAAKAGLITLARVAALEGGPKNVRANAVLPGSIETAMTLSTPAEVRDQWADQIPLKRWGQPEEIARAIAFLSSPLASYINGVALLVDGGYTIHG